MRDLSALDLFIIHCVERGMHSGYALQRQAGLSLGASTPALKRLTESGHLRRVASITAGRKRYDFSATGLGKSTVRHGWKRYVSGSKSLNDVDSILRVLELATCYGAGKKEIRNFLLRALEIKKEMAARYVLQFREPTIAYTYLRSLFEASRANADVAVLTEINKLVATRGRKSARTITSKRRKR